MAYRNITRDTFNEIFHNSECEVLINVGIVDVDISSAYGEWRNDELVIIGGTNPSITVSRFQSEDIAGAYSDDDDEIETVTVEVTGGYLRFQKKSVPVTDEYLEGVTDAFGVMAALIRNNMNDSIYEGITTLAELKDLNRGDLLSEIMVRGSELCEELGIKEVEFDDDGYPVYDKYIVTRTSIPDLVQPWVLSISQRCTQKLGLWSGSFYGPLQHYRHVKYDAGGRNE